MPNSPGPMDRRAFFRDALRGRFGARRQTADSESGRVTSGGEEARSRPAVGRATSFPVHRPPGALPEPEFLSACTRCGDCVVACPHHAIVLAPSRLRGAAGTPMIEPHTQPCWLCSDLPCVTACEPDVLSLARSTRMSEARIQPWACLAHQGTMCSACVEQCPVPGSITVEQGRPTVVATECVGCGVCQYVCPAPENAVLLLPIDREG